MGYVFPLPPYHLCPTEFVVLSFVAGLFGYSINLPPVCYGSGRTYGLKRLSGQELSDIAFGLPYLLEGSDKNMVHGRLVIPILCSFTCFQTQRTAGSSASRYNISPKIVQHSNCPFRQPPPFLCHPDIGPENSECLLFLCSQYLTDASFFIIDQYQVS